MSATVPITVGIPTFSRGDRVFQSIKHILGCDPAPAEIIVHVDASDGEGQKILVRHPSVKVLSSPVRVGPGGGRHRCILASTQPYFATFDDDSWPVDVDFFARVMQRMAEFPSVGILATTIALRAETMPPLTSVSVAAVDFIGCGHILRADAYRGLTGYVDRPNAYGLEERDLALQMHAAGWLVMRCGDLRVFHDTDLAHEKRLDITRATIENAALLVLLRYPLALWPYGFLQYANVVRFMLSRGRFWGALLGLLGTPLAMWRFRHLRRPISGQMIRSYLRGRKHNG